MICRKLVKKFLLVASISGIGAFLYWMVEIGKCPVTENSSIPETVRLSPEAREKLFRLMKACDLTIQMEQPRQLFKFTLEPMKKIESMRRKNEEVSWTAVNMIKSAINHRDRRDAIRRTWGSIRRWEGVQMTTIFILGNTPNEEEQRKVEEEFNEFGDILQADVEEVYKLITKKTLAGMQWAGEVLPPNWLYSSGDDDFAIHIPNFVRFIEKAALQHNWNNPPLRKVIEHFPIICIYSYRTKDDPHRSPSSKWYVSPRLYSARYWPPYCRGGWYSFPVATVSKLYGVSRYSPFLHLDDVWITGILRLRMLAPLPEIDEKSLLAAALLEAPLANRTDLELMRNLKEDDLSNVLVSHKGRYIDSKKANVTQSLMQAWEKWKPTIGKAIKQQLTL